MIKLALFASGRGSNVRAIVDRFAREDDVDVALVLSNKAKAPVLDFASECGIPVHVTNRDEFRSAESVLPVLKDYNVDWIALAGFLWLVPLILIEAYPDRIVNIHPSILPKFGGKGMYGMHVHEAVLKAREPISGITIHLVSNEYDKGQVLYSHSVPIDSCKNSKELANLVLKLEHKYYPEVLLYHMRHGTKGEHFQRKNLIS